MGREAIRTVGGTMKSLTRKWLLQQNHLNSRKAKDARELKGMKTVAAVELKHESAEERRLMRRVKKNMKERRLILVKMRSLNARLRSARDSVKNLHRKLRSVSVRE